MAGMNTLPFLSSFALILLAELPDKTLYTVLILAARNRPMPVLLGAFVVEWGDATQIGTAALVARSPEHRWQVLSGATLGLWVGASLAVAVGRAAGRWLPEAAMRRVAGAVFCAFAIFSVLHRFLGSAPQGLLMSTSPPP
jgi:putative Ca2+/H+ antiporter (TMEM165/GDT1 family)